MGLFDVGKKAVTRWNPVGGAVTAGYKAAKGDFKGAGGALASGATFGATDAAQYGWNKAKEGAEGLVGGLQQPYEDAAQANEKAAQQTEQVGQRALDMTGAGINRALDQTTPAARQWSKTYELGGELAGPGYTEQLYKDRMGAGINSALKADYADGVQAIDDQLGSMGIGRSGAALKAKTMLGERIINENQRQLAGLAGQADSTRETRLGGALDRIAGLGNSRAGIVQQGTQAGVDSWTAGQLGGIQGRLAAANARNKFQTDMIGAGANLGGKALGYIGG